MYTMIIDGTLKSGMQSAFLSAWSGRILPALKSQDGFVDEILLFEKTEPIAAVGLSFWKSEEQAKKYQRDVFPKLVNEVQQYLNTAPTVRSFDVVASGTFRIATDRAA